jgi:hypothetical protein
MAQTESSSFLRRTGRYCRLAGLLSLIAGPMLLGAAAAGAQAPDGPAQEAESEPAPPDDPRHRVDFGLEWFDAAEGDTLTGVLN